MLKRGNWSVEELERVRAQFARRPIEQLARSLRRTEDSVRDRARRIFKRTTQRGALTNAEQAELRAMVGIASIEEMALVLARARNRVLDVLQSWRDRRRSGRWADWELRYLRDFASKRPDWALELVTGRSRGAIVKRCAEYCIGTDRSLVPVELPELGTLPTLVLEPRASRRMPRWQAEDVERLRILYPIRPNLDLARIFGRSVKSIRAKAQDLGLKKAPERLEAMGRENVQRRYQRSSRRSARD